ncbi:MAG: ABC-2 family transporter protein [Candidatus Edwardsbacteria bacterium]
MNRLYFYLRLFFGYLANALKTRMAYRQDFFIGFFSNIFTQLIGILFVWAIFQKVTDIKGWRREEIFFIYGFSQMSLSFFFIFFMNLFNLSEEYVIEGRFDRLLVRPLSTFFQVLFERIYWEESSGLFVGIMMIAYSLSRLGFSWSLFDYLAIIPFILGATLLYLGCFTILASLTFWFKERGGIIGPFLSLEIFSRYPITIYNRGIRIILSWIIPYGFTAFYPATRFLKRSEFSLFAWLAPLIGVIFFSFGCLFWQKGSKAYESTGS